MKKIFFISLVVLLFSTNSKAQQLNPVKWNSTIEKVNETTYNLVFSATIQPGWHLYNLQIPEGGPIPTTFTFEKSKGVKYEGKIKAITKPVKAHDQSFGMDLEYFSTEALFKQQVKISKGKKGKISGSVLFMCCDDHQCIPPSEFKFQIPVG